jgi:hypothetical protein
MLDALLAMSSVERFLELRLITPEGKVAQQFHQVQALRANGCVVPGLDRWDGVANAYYGITPRIRRSGTAADCGPALAAWADFDRELPPSLPLPPSVLINSSPGKRQVLWLLDTPCPDLARIESLNRAIVAATGADKNACDRARVLRLPGYRNMKYAERPQARLLVCNSDVRYSLTDLESAFPPPPAARPAMRIPKRPYAVGAAPSWLALVYDAICQHLEDTGRQLRPGRDGGVSTTCPMHHHDNASPSNDSLSLHPVRGWKCFGGCGQGRLTLLAARLGVTVHGGPPNGRG